MACILGISLAPGTVPLPHSFAKDAVESIYKLWHKGIFIMGMMMEITTLRHIGYFAVLLLTACATPAAAPPGQTPRPQQPAPEIVAAPEHIITYQCDNNLTAIVTLRGAERATLNISGAATELFAMRTASGVKFATPDNSIIFWSAGNEAQIITTQSAGETHLSCRIAS